MKNDKSNAFELGRSVVKTSTKAEHQELVDPSLVKAGKADKVAKRARRPIDDEEALDGAKIQNHVWTLDAPEAPLPLPGQSVLYAQADSTVVSDAPAEGLTPTPSGIELPDPSTKNVMEAG